MLWRRFSEFYQLRSTLLKKHRGYGIHNFPFPPKVWFRSRTPATIASRQQMLERFMNNLLDMAVLFPEVRQFLTPTARTRRGTTALDTSPQQRAAGSGAGPGSGNTGAGHASRSSATAALGSTGGSQRGGTAAQDTPAVASLRTSGGSKSLPVDVDDHGTGGGGRTNPSQYFTDDSDVENDDDDDDDGRDFLGGSEEEDDHALAMTPPEASSSGQGQGTNGLNRSLRNRNRNRNRDAQHQQQQHAVVDRDGGMPSLMGGIGTLLPTSATARSAPTGSPFLSSSFNRRRSFDQTLTVGSPAGQSLLQVGGWVGSLVRACVRACVRVCRAGSRASCTVCIGLQVSAVAQQRVLIWA